MTSLPPDPDELPIEGEQAAPKKERGRIRWGLIGALVLLALIFILSVQNTQAVEVRFLGWSSEEIPLSLVILGTALVAVVLDELFGFAWRVRRRRRVKAKG
ncbi:MAG: DUF1049 domain-containing protein [Acidimicrobiia bacterium]|nr:DUF1049 domain-containing protein [Acidimicrobiia bacterium]